MLLGSTFAHTPIVATNPQRHSQRYTLQRRYQMEVSPAARVCSMGYGMAAEREDEGGGSDLGERHIVLEGGPPVLVRVGMRQRSAAPARI